MQLERFPLLVRNGIQTLFAQPPEEVAKRDELDQARERVVKLGQIRLLEDYFISRTAAVAGMEMVWEGEAPFCLFLRSFAMGHRVEPQAFPVVSEEWQLTQLDTSEPVGGRLLSLVGDALHERAALVAVANPAEWLPHRLVNAPFTNLVLGDDKWHSVVSSLIDASQLIVLHRAGTSTGVARELDTIRSAGRMDATVIVREPEIADDEEPQSGWGSLFAELERRNRAREQARAGKLVFPPDPELEGFRVLEWRDDESLKAALSDAVDALLAKDVRRTFGPMPPFEPPAPSRDEAAQSLIAAQRDFQAASRCMSAGDLRMAEEFLFECYATSCDADDVGGRTSACLELGRLFLLRLGDPDSAAVPLEYASGHFMVIGQRDYALEALHLFAAAQLMRGDSAAAQAIVDQAETYEQTEDNREWQRRFWGLIEERAADDQSRRFAAELTRR